MELSPVEGHYKSFLKTGVPPGPILKYFNQHGRWSPWEDNSLPNLEYLLEKDLWTKLKDNLSNYQLPKDKIEQGDGKGGRILNTSYHTPSTKREALKEPLTLPYAHIKGVIKSTAKEIFAPNLKSTGAMIIQGKDSISILQAPKLELVTEDLRIWKVNFQAPNLKEIGGNLLLEHSIDSNIELPKLKTVGKSIYCRGCPQIDLPSLEIVGESLNAHHALKINLPRLRNIKELTLNTKKLNRMEIENILSKLEESSLQTLYSNSKQSNTVSIANPGGSHLYELIKAEQLKRKLLKLKLENSLTID